MNATAWVLLRFFLAMAAISIAGCGGSGSSGQGDKPAGYGNSVQRTAQITIHRASGNEVQDYGGRK